MSNGWKTFQNTFFSFSDDKKETVLTVRIRVFAEWVRVFRQVSIFCLLWKPEGDYSIVFTRAR